MAKIMWVLIEISLRFAIFSVETLGFVRWCRNFLYGCHSFGIWFDIKLLRLYGSSHVLRCPIGSNHRHRNINESRTSLSRA